VAFQLPRVNRFAPQAEESVGRLQVNTPDLGRGQAMQTKAVGNLVEGAARMYEGYQVSAADTEADKAAYDFDKSANESLLQIKDQDGNPDPVYQKYDEDRQRKYNEILETYKDADDLVKTKVKEKLDLTNGKYSDRALQAKYSQRSRYEKSVADSTISIIKDDMFEATAFMDPKALDTSALDIKLQDLESTIIKYGEKRGLVTEIEGKIAYLPSLQEQLAKETSEGLTNTIENLLRSKDSKQVELGNMLADKYKDRIDVVNQKKLNTVQKEAGAEQQAFIELEKVMNLAPDEAMRRLKEIPGEVGEKARAKMHTFRLQMDEAKASANKTRSEVIGRAILERRQQGRPFRTIDELESDPKVARLIPLLDPKTREAAHAMVVKPKFSEPEAVFELNNAIASGELKGMTANDLAQLQVGLSEKESNRAQREWSLANKETDTDRNRMQSGMMTELKKQLQGMGYVRIGAASMGKRDMTRMNEATEKFNEQFDNLPPNMSLKDRTEWVKSLAVSIAKDEVFRPPSGIQKAAVSYEPLDDRQIVRNETPAAKIPQATVKQEMEVRKAWRRDNGGVWPDINSTAYQKYRNNYLKTNRSAEAE
jgi:hypothetical protein